MEIAIAEETQTQPDDHESSARKGVVLRKWLLMGEAADGLNFRLFRSKYQDGDLAFQSPRHHHGFQQIRWAEVGSINYGPEQDIPEGDIAYFPRGTYYGPQLKDQGVSLLLQYGFGPELEGATDPMHRNRDRIRERLAARGEQTDVALEARYEIPPEGYAEPILLHPKAFEYYDAAPGVEVKQLGGFYDHSGAAADVRISTVRLSAEGVHQLSSERAQIAWSTGPGLQIAGMTYPALTCIYSPRDEDVNLTAPGGVELFVVEFPRLD